MQVALALVCAFTTLGVGIFVATIIGQIGMRISDRLDGFSLPFWMGYAFIFVVPSFFAAFAAAAYVFSLVAQ